MLDVLGQAQIQVVELRLQGLCGGLLLCPLALRPGVGGMCPHRLTT